MAHFLHRCILAFIFFTLAADCLHAQCSTEFVEAGYNAGCGTTATLWVYDDEDVATSFRWYKKTTTGSWQYLSETPSDGGYAQHNVTVTSTTIFGVTILNSSSYCESAKLEISVAPGTKPSAGADGVSCAPGTATIQARSATPGVTFQLYKYVNNSYSYIGANTSGTFTLNDFNVSDQYNYYVKPVKSGCTGNFSGVYFEIMHDLSSPNVSGNTPICRTGSLTLTASGASESDYRWYNASNQMINGNTGAQLHTGTLTANTTFYVSYIQEGDMLVCESPKRRVDVVVNNPAPPVVSAKTACSTGNVTLTASTGYTYTAYKWFLNGSTTAATQTTTASYTRAASGVSSYRVSGIINGCESGLSNSAAITLTTVPPPNVWKGFSCGPGNQTIYAEYDDFGNGPPTTSYSLSYFTVATGGSAAYTATIAANSSEAAAYTVNLSSSKDYWVSATVAGCSSPRTYFRATVPTPPNVSGSGFSCSANQLSIEMNSASNVANYYLYLHDGTNYNQVGSNTTGVFTLSNFYDGDATKYYARVRTTSNCYSPYRQVEVEVTRPAAPNVTGTTTICVGAATTLTASGGSAGSYRWYDANNNLLSTTSAQLNTGILNAKKEYYVAYMAEGDLASCESPKKKVTVTVNPKPAKPILAEPFVTKCNAGKVTLVASSPYATYQWFDQNNNLVSGNTNADYKPDISQLDTELTFRV
jgi:hypothetical protein